MVFQVFEHQTLKIGQHPNFTEQVWETLIRFNDKHEQRYFTVIHRGVRFRHYVGVIQVGQLTIEILPKADANEDLNDVANKNRWQSVLISMLKTCRLLKIESLSNAHLRLQQHFILDLYFELFIDEVEQLLHEGLIKQYRNITENQTSMRGRLDFSKQIQHNTVHKTRFFVQHSTYDFNHFFNQILYKTIAVLKRIVTNPLLLDRLQRLHLYFPKVQNIDIRDWHFQNIKYDRKSQRYQTALEISRLILMNYSPDIRGGQNDVLAMLFDMNVLFETFIFRHLKRLESSQNIQVIGQPNRKFWTHNQSSRNLRPDILIQKEGKNIILDTKWKVLKRPSPSDEDLRQMYAYANIFKAEKTILLYPKVFDYQSFTKGIFNQSNGLACDLFFVNVVDENGLNREMGKNILGLLS
jgi:5-methylcytosine-specific restriction enzyme subunit McrC